MADLGGNVIKIGTRKAQLLFAYFLLHQHIPHPREKLIDLFWPEAAEASGKQNLRQALYSLRNVFEKSSTHKEKYFFTDQQNIRFDGKKDFEVDALTLELSLKQTQTNAKQNAATLLKQAVDLYKGPLLHGCYDDWAFELQEYFKTLYIKALNQLVHLHVDVKEPDHAIEYAKRSLTADPLQEEIHRALMLIYLSTDNRSAALRQYQECKTLLQAELDVDPLPETQSLHQEILQRSAEEQLSLIVDDLETLPADFTTLGTPFVNRQTELKQLTSTWTKVIQKKGQAVLMGGEAGVGKTRLIREFEWFCSRDHVTAFSGRCYEFEGKMPYQPIAEALRDSLPSISDQEIKALPKRVLTEMLALNPNLSEIFPHLQASQLLTSPDQERNRSLENLKSFFVEISKKRPLLLFIDDLQWADQATLEFLHYLIRHIDCEQILVIGAYRQEALHDLHPLVEMIENLTKERMLISLHLEPLEDQHTLDLAQQVLHSDVSKEWIQQLLAQSQGIPFYVEELIKTSIEAGGLKQDEQGVWQVHEQLLASENIPSSIQALVKTRLRRLSRPGRQILDLLSADAQGVSSEVLRRAQPGSSLNLYEPLEELSKARFIEDRGTHYHCRHDLLRQVIYQDLSAEKRRHLHSVLANAYESAYQEYGPARDPLTLIKLAQHFHRAERWKKALAYSLEAGELIWKKKYALEEALQLFNQALEIAEYLEDQEGMCRAYTGLGSVCATTDKQEAGLGYCQKALELSTKSEIRAEIYGYIASVYHSKREMETGLDYCEKAIAEFTSTSKSLVAAKIYQQAASFLNWTRHYKKAILYCETAMHILDQHSEPMLYAQGLSYLGQAFSGLKEYKKSVESHKRAVALAEEINDPMSIGLAYFQLGIAQYYKKDLMDSIDSWKVSLSQLEQLSGQHDAITVILNRLIHAYLCLKKIEQAKSLAISQLEEAKKSDNSVSISVAYGMLGCIATHLNEDEAGNYFKASLKIESENAILYGSIILTYLYLDDYKNAMRWFLKGKPYLRKRDFELIKSLPSYTPAIKTFRQDPAFLD